MIRKWKKSSSFVRKKTKKEATEKKELEIDLTGKEKVLVLVESPHKARTIAKILGQDYLVYSTNGHIYEIDGIRGKFTGIDIENDFRINYRVIEEKKSIVKGLIKLAKKKSLEKIILAADADREGEFIGRSVENYLRENNIELPIKRAFFLEITKESILKSINHLTELDEKKIKSQNTRMILDRIIGFSISPVLWRILNSRTESAGRVQSTLLLELLKRYIEKRDFIPIPFYEFQLESNIGTFYLFYNNEKQIRKEDYERIQRRILSLNLKSLSISEEEQESYGKRVFPLITSTLQSRCFEKFHFSLSRTMSIAQRLYEGVKIGEDYVGLITYMRTDSQRLSEEFQQKTKDYIEKSLQKGASESYFFKERQSLVQGAHEAIRPTSIELTPDYLEAYLSKDELKVYSIIYNQSLAALMKVPEFRIKKIKLLIEQDHYFELQLRRIEKEGYLLLDYFRKEEHCNKDYTKEKLNFSSSKIEVKEKFTEAPGYYSQASVVKFMSREGIGRPSTYARIIETLLKRGYAKEIEKKIVITEKGKKLSRIFISFFRRVFNLQFTSSMEESLDLIEKGEKNYLEVLRSFFSDFKKEYLFFTNLSSPIKLLEVEANCEMCEKQLELFQNIYGLYCYCSKCEESYPVSYHLLLTFSSSLEEDLSSIIKREDSIIEIDRQNRYLTDQICSCGTHKFLVFDRIKKVPLIVCSNASCKEHSIFSIMELKEDLLRLIESSSRFCLILKNE